MQQSEERCRGDSVARRHKRWRNGINRESQCNRFRLLLNTEDAENIKVNASK